MFLEVEAVLVLLAFFCMKVWPLSIARTPVDVGARLLLFLSSNVYRTAGHHVNSESVPVVLDSCYLWSGVAGVPAGAYDMMRGKGTVALVMNS